MEPTQRATEWNEMVIFDCPWCAEPAMVEVVDTDEVVCESCGVQAPLAPDPGARLLAQAA